MPQFSREFEKPTVWEATVWDADSTVGSTTCSGVGYDHDLSGFLFCVFARNEAISLIRFECTADLDKADLEKADLEKVAGGNDYGVRDFGAQAEQIETLSAKLERIQSGWIDANSSPTFLDLPQRLHSDYQRDRELSPLGRVFTIANAMHDEIDAVVVVGSAVALGGIRALIGACCDPLHNELTRAQRGSRPRIYFAGDSPGNDALSALLQRLGTPTPESSPDRWAVIAVSDHDPDGTVSAVLSHLLGLMSNQFGSDKKIMQRFFIPFVRGETWLHRLATSIGCQEVFEVDDDVAEPFGVMSLANHLPAALLGLDCMRWLGGAHELKEHCLHAPIGQNVVLQFMLWKRLTSKDSDSQAMSLNVYADCLESFGRWHELFLASSSPVQGSSIHVRSFVCPRDQARQSARSQNALQLNFRVMAPRTDRLPEVSFSFLESFPHNEPDVRPQTDFRTSQPNGSASDPPSSNPPAFDLVVPEIDTFTMGQLFQLIMIGAEVDRQLLLA